MKIHGLEHDDGADGFNTSRYELRRIRSESDRRRRMPEYPGNIKAHVMGAAATDRIRYRRWEGFDARAI